MMNKIIPARVTPNKVSTDTLGTQAATGNPDIQAIGSWARQVYASLGKLRRREVLKSRLLAAGLGKSRQVGNHGKPGS